MKPSENKQPKRLLKRIIPLLLLLPSCLMAAGAPPPTAATTAADSVCVFRFVARNDMFYIPWQGNDAQLVRLCRLVEAHRAAIGAGTLPVHVDSYCASLPTEKENLATAFIRANRVKSELITRQGLKETDFITANYARAYLNQKDAVVVTLRIPAAKEPEEPQTVQQPPRRDEPKDEVKPQPAAQQQPAATPQSATTPLPPPAQPPAKAAKPYCLALRTNLLYDAMLLPTLGVEWRVNHRWGIRLDGSLSHWGGDRGEVQKIWMLSPEVRYYLLRDRRFYVGLSANYAEYNLYGYLPGKFLPDDTGYQGHLWSAGLSAGYRLPLWRCLSADFNLALGYTRSAYDSFTAPYGVRVIKQRDRKKNLWGPTQTGISLVWTIGNNK